MPRLASPSGTLREKAAVPLQAPMGAGIREPATKSDTNSRCISPPNVSKLLLHAGIAVQARRVAY